ncbi:hypothetical protein R5R35_005168 [Gryllus longicercus]|uniref:Accessory gland protein n=1 Tax=Gryllus longicercus TaxID=2509291 RepID=A0AAN9V733_9ORTH
MMKLPSWFVVGLWLLVANWCILAYGDNGACVPGQKVGSQVVINSHRNDTGHWVSQVEVINKDAEAKHNSMDMDVREYTFRCKADKLKYGSTNQSFTTTSVKLIDPRPAGARDAALEARFTAVARVLGRRRLLFFSEARLTWEEARRACAGRGMRLAHYSHSNAPALNWLLRSGESFYLSDVFVSTGDETVDKHADQTDLESVFCPTFDGYRMKNSFRCTTKLPFFCQRDQTA